MKGNIIKSFKKLYKSFIKLFKKYTSTNVLFLSFVIISIILEMSLRLATVGSGYVFTLKPFLSDLMILLLIGAFGYLFKPKYQFVYFFTWLLFGTLLCIGNTIYYEFFKSFLSVNLISTSSMIGEVNDSLFDKLHFYQFLFLIFPTILIIIHKRLCKKKYYFEVEKVEKSKKMFTYTLFSAGIIAFILFCTLTSTEISRFVKQWNREYIVQRFGVYTYTINDLIQSVQPKIDTLFGYDGAAKTFREYYSCKWEKETKENNSYTNIFNGKNVIFIHMESIQNFLVDLTINGQEVTPNINRLTKEGIYFSKFYPQISIGTSSDTEFTLLTGLMPSSSGTVFVNYYDRNYSAMPEYFNQLGYYTFSMHANNAGYWNRKLMHKNLGYQKFYAKDMFEIPSEDDPEYIGLGLSDKSFFKQIQPYLLEIKAQNTPYFGTIITLSNHSPFNELDKYSDFNLNMNYSYVNENGETVYDVANYLEDTSIGNYIKSAHYADEALGELFEELRSNGLLENTIFVLYGDHEARLAKKQFDLLYNYDPITDNIKDSDSEGYYDLGNYTYDLLKNTPLIIWSGENNFNTNITDVMGMYDILPTIANMFGFEEKYSLGNDIFSNNEKIVVFPNGNVLTNKIYYSNLNDNYVAFTNEVIESDYIDRIKEYANEILDVSNGIIVHNLIKNEGDRIGECDEEKTK